LIAVHSPAILGILLTVTMETCQQLAYKLAAKGDKLKLPWLGAGAMLYIPQQACWMFALSALPLAIAAPLLGASYVTVPLAGSRVFKERITSKQWIGIALIVAGMALISREMQL
jgi:undecaprenyl phosphate-alpha-L-ara4N flippase subunit ArnE